MADLLFSIKRFNLLTWTIRDESVCCFTEGFPGSDAMANIENLPEEAVKNEAADVLVRLVIKIL